MSEALPQAVKLPRGKRAAVLDWLSKGPFAIIAASLQGGVNYAIVLYLSFGAGMVATGQYRTLFSYYTLLALAAMPESNKVFIKSVVMGEKSATTALFVNRAVCGAVVMLVIFALWGIGRASGRAMVPDALVIIAVISAIVYPFDNYIALLQARRRFRTLVITECIKYGGAFSAFIAMISLGHSVETAVIVQLLTMGVAILAFYAIFARGWLDFALIREKGLRLVFTPPASQARTLSAANFLPSSLDSLDKLAVGAVFGLYTLGIYTLAYSTGRFLYNVLKPAMYVYYRKFVDAMPGWPLLRRVSAVFTAIGALTAGLFLLGIHYIPGMAKFESGKFITVILFLSYGIGILNAVYSQAFALNKDSKAHHAFFGAAAGTLIAFAIMATAMLTPWAIASILLALQYPVRDGVSVLVSNILRVRRQKRGEAI